MKRLNGAFNVCKSPREPRKKDVQKHKAKAFVESIARKCFGYNYKGFTVTKQSRQDCFKYKLVVVKSDALERIRHFHHELEYRFTDFKVVYTGSINSKTGREEWCIEILVFGELVEKVHNEPECTETSPAPCYGMFS